MRRCRQCKTKYEPFNSLQATCSIDCAVKWARTAGAKEVVAKARKSETREMRKVFNSTNRSHWIKTLDTVFNKYIRLRDAKDGCISCDTKTGQAQAGHFKPKGANGQLRWHEANVHGQCAQCNNHMSGNLTEYRKRLVLKVGPDTVEWLEGPHEIQKRQQIPELKLLIETYKQKVKKLELQARYSDETI